MPKQVRLRAALAVRRWARCLPPCSVRGRIIAGFGLLVIILAIVVAGSAWLLREHRSYLAEMDHDTTTVLLLQDARMSGAEAFSLLELYLITGDEMLVPAIRSLEAAASASLASARAQEEREGNGKLSSGLGHIMARAALVFERFERAVALRQSGDVQAATTALLGTLPSLQRIQVDFDELAGEERREVAELRGQADSAGDLVFWLLVVSGTAGAALGLAASVLIARSILRPLASLERSALAVTGGDLEARAPSAGPRELVRLGGSLNRMTESLLDASKRRELQAERERAFAQLRESEKKFRTLLENAPVAVVITDSAGRIHLVNAAAESMFGYDQREILGRQVELLLPQRFRRAHGGKCAAYLAGSAPPPAAFSRDVMGQREDGSEFPATCALASVETASGRLAISFIVDMSDRKRAEEELRRLNEQLEEERRETEALNRSLESKVRRRTEDLRESEERFRRAFEDAPIGVAIIGRDYRLMKVNRALCEMLGYAEHELTNKTFVDITHPEDIEKDVGLAQQTFRGEIPSYKLEKRYIKKDRGVLWIDLTATVIRLKSAKASYGLALIENITDRKRAEEEVRIANQKLRERNRQLLDARAQAATDELTGLRNHRAFHERIREEISRARQNGNKLGLIMMDIDGFKRINDAQGHLSGDQILRELAATLAAEIRREDVYRYGGDEFAVVLPAARRRQAIKVAERLRRAVEKRADGNGDRVTVSLGVTSFPETATSTEELIYEADAAMYWAKSAGKNRVGDWNELVAGRTEGALPWYAADRAVKAPDVIAALVAALDAKDPITSAHTERCSWYAGKLAEEIGLTEEEASIVRLASLLHDIGKLAVPDEVLFKPGPLNEQEWKQMKQHSTAALHVLGHVRSITSATPAILHHHEHFDGSGYPDGLAGDDIPVASRILLVTDAFDAMTTDRPYRKAISIDAAVEELKRNSGSQFDPEIVEAFLRILAREGAQPLCGTAPDQAETVGAAARRRRTGRSASSP